MMGCDCAGARTALVTRLAVTEMLERNKTREKGREKHLQQVEVSLAFNLTLLGLFCNMCCQSSSHTAVPTVPPEEEPEQK